MSRRRLAAGLLVLVTCSVGFAAATPDQGVLVVADADTGDELVTAPVHEGSTVILSYTHSVEQSPVDDVYTVHGTRLDNSLMRFESYGWGLPADADVTRQNGRFVFDPDGSYDELYVEPGRIAGHTLTVDGATYDLVTLSNGSTVRITVERRPPLSLSTYTNE